VVLAAATLTGLICLQATASPFGINAHVPSAEIMDEVVHAHIAWIRIDFVWPFVEPEQDSFDWSLYDQLLAEADARGLRVLASAGGTPQWATSGSLFNGVPDDPDDWRDFCYRAAYRYRGRVQAWAFWNEPNLEQFWEGSRNQYLTEILRPGAEAVHAADPDALICGPDLAHLQSAHWEDWLEEAIENTSDLLDVVTHHVYPSDGMAYQVTNDLHEGSDLPWDPPSVRSVLRDTGWWGRPFWLTETGVQSDEYGPEIQARFYTELLTEWFAPERELSWVGRIMFYEIHDDPTHPEISWGLLEAPPELTRKEAYQAYRDFIRTSSMDDAELVEGTPPAFIRSSETLDIAITMRNTGTTVWSGDAYRLLARVDQDGWSVECDELPQQGGVAPGESVTLHVVIQVPGYSPLQPDIPVQFFARMERVGQWTFGDVVAQTMVLSGDQPARFELHPQTWTLVPGESAQFRVGVVSESEVSYQWRRNTIVLSDDEHLSGTDTAELLVSNADVHITGGYDCVVTNDAGSVVSEAGHLVLLEPDQDPEMRRSDGRLGPDRDLVQAWLRHRRQTPMQTAETAPFSDQTR
jgi:hypothetical protein